jgi:hypothetical protein
MELRDVEVYGGQVGAIDVVFKRYTLPNQGE